MLLPTRILTIWIVVVGLCYAAAVRTALAEPTVNGFRIGLQPDATRIVLDLSAPIGQVPIALLANPFRVVVELPPVDWQVAPPTNQKRGLVEAYRFGAVSATQSRLVLDVAKPVRVVRAFALPPGEGRSHRYVIDIAETSEREFRAASEVSGAPQTAPSNVNEARPIAQRPAAERAQPIPRERKPLVVIDPGHGGVDPGAISASGLYEKNITLLAARELKAALDAGGKVRSQLTRNDDVFLRLRDRIAVARSASAQLFVSLHADSIKTKSLQGASVYTLSENASDDEAAALAQRENRADVIAGLDLTGERDDVTNILIDLTQRETMNLSARFANVALGELRKFAPLVPKSHRFAGFAVLKAPDVPSVLVELGYLSNREDEKALASKAGRKPYIDGLARAIEAYFVEVKAN